MSHKHTPKPAKPSRSAAYGVLLADLKRCVRSAWVRAALAVNRELMRLYWNIGREILRSQKAEGWGTKVIERLAKDLRAEFPGMSGLSRTNLLYMRAFAEAYSGAAIVQQPAGQLESDTLPEPFASLPWFHNCVLLGRVKDLTARLWYARQTLVNGWSRPVLEVQIETKAHKRAGRAVNNFATTLPPEQSDLAQQVLKDPDTFDFLALAPNARERDLENALIEHIQKFLLELGVGFAFVGRQVALEIDGEDYVIDLLFYHLRLRCFVVIDLKMRGFKPEDAGKMSFYLSAVDEQMRHDGDQLTIGLLLCKDHKRLTVEYALRTFSRPIGVSQWRTRLVDSLPRQLRGVLPSVADFERNLR